MNKRQRSQRTFGIEEEFLLLDAHSGLPVNRAAEVIDAASIAKAHPEREFFASQLETATPVCETAEAAEAALTAFRDAVSDAAWSCGAVLASTGLPPSGGDAAGRITPNARYRRILAEMRGAATHQYVTGTHVHVEVPSRDAGVGVLAHLARWAPALLALTANSPFWCGEDTGFASWRYVQGLSWPVAGFPVGFGSAAEYDESVANLVDTGVLLDSGRITWAARMSDKCPTVEVRIADAQLTPEASVAYALIVRALVHRALQSIAAGEAVPRYAPGFVNGAICLAARDGMASDLIDPLTAERLSARAFVDRMIASIAQDLEEFGDRSRIDDYLARIEAHGDPAAQQRRAHESGGIEALLKLYTSAHEPER